MNKNFQDCKCKEVPSEKGSYILLIKLSKKLKLSISTLGEFELAPGNYVYVGSALGPGGLKPRILRHLASSKRIYWHIDYVTTNPSAKVEYISFILSNEKLECKIARELLNKGFVPVIHGFGASDCIEGCPSHFLKCEDILISCLRKVEKVLKKFGKEYGIVRP